MSSTNLPSIFADVQHKHQEMYRLTNTESVLYELGNENGNMVHFNVNYKSWYRVIFKYTKLIINSSIKEIAFRFTQKRSQPTNCAVSNGIRSARSSASFTRRKSMNHLK